MQHFDHERREVYQLAIRFVGLANEVVEQLSRGRGYLADQLQRAATSTECAAILDVCRSLALISEDRFGAGREQLLRIVSMLTKHGRSVVSGTGRGT